MSLIPERPAELLCLAQRYLTHSLKPGPDLEAAWIVFHEHYSRKIRKYAFSCGAREKDIADCVQEVWTELLIRLPTFRLDPKRGQFDTWLFHIVRGKTTNLHRAHKRALPQESNTPLDTLRSTPTPPPKLPWKK